MESTVYVIQQQDDTNILYSLVTKEVQFLGNSEYKTFKNFVAEGSLSKLMQIKEKLEGNCEK